ncbi:MULTISPECIES: pyridoxamine 5'-phosphate oxidase family protein [Microbacterium]|uniref:pyridoxamine 5'-phosphate oxidase family protein n=1 Tax=Microbacterium TaxID=33882 RepID=UPI0027893767|nr:MULTISPECIES: pyridoxamine 5'-phosphate oxidase family protein [Microbacterium]MDQ1083684.1 general stress protein 26 [Microbacterium sp. SORGH_AS_0344]MDQ1171039.1 general stress protein 26 [Microbacterium proteolyticum]
MSSTASELEKLNELLKTFRFAMVTTRAEDGALHAHPLTVQETESDGDLWFIVGTDASAVAHVRRDPKVGLSFSSDSTWLSLAGEAEVIDDRAKLKELWSTTVEAWFPDGPESPGVTLLRVNTLSGEYWGSAGGKIATAIALVTSKVTGERPKGGEKEKFDLPS